MPFDDTMSKPVPQFEIELNIYCVEICGTRIRTLSKALCSMINRLLISEIKVFQI